MKFETAFLKSEKAILSPLEIEDSELFWKWSQDRQVVKYALKKWIWPNSKNQIRAWLDSPVRDRTTFSLGICSSDDGALIGEAGICRIDPINRSGEYYIFIGDHADRFGLKYCGQQSLLKVRIQT